MRVANFRDDLIKGIAALLSIDPTIDVSPEMAASWCQYINTRSRYGWGVWDWPDLTVTQERAFRPIWRSDQDYFAQDEVCYLPNLLANQNTSNKLNSYFRALSEVPEGAANGPGGANSATYWQPINQTATFNDGVSTVSTTTFTSATANFNAGDVNQPIAASVAYVPAGTTIASVTNATTIVLSQAAIQSGTGISFTISGRSTALDKYIAYDQSGQAPIGEVYAIFNYNPRLYPSLQPPGLKFRPSEKGIDIWPFTGDSVFVNYKIPPSKFTTTPWAAGLYTYGQSVYWTDGNCYQCGVASTLNDPTDLTSWFVIPLPNVLLDYVKAAAAADAADDTQTEATLLQEADDYLSREIDKLMAQGEQHFYSLRKPHREWIPYGVAGFWWSISAPWSGGVVSTLTDALYSPISQDRRPSLITENAENIVTENGENILAA